MPAVAFWVCMAAAIVGATHTLWAVAAGPDDSQHYRQREDS